MTVPNSLIARSLSCFAQGEENWPQSIKFLSKYSMEIWQPQATVGYLAATYYSCLSIIHVLAYATL